MRTISWWLLGACAGITCLVAGWGLAILAARQLLLAVVAYTTVYHALLAAVAAMGKNNQRMASAGDVALARAAGIAAAVAVFLSPGIVAVLAVIAVIAVFATIIKKR